LGKDEITPLFFRLTSSTKVRLRMVKNQLTRGLNILAKLTLVDPNSLISDALVQRNLQKYFQILKQTLVEGLNMNLL
jgi:hypothetical protein